MRLQAGSMYGINKSRVACVDGFADVADGEGTPIGFSDGGETGGTAVFFVVLADDRRFQY
jgi:hypothetical protein